VFFVKHIKTINRATQKQSVPHGGCGECRTSCQSACKTSCTVANQKCERPQAAALAEIKQATGRTLA
jgi:predicted ribosomally synthesized six-cysteine peptide SCIFF